MSKREFLKNDDGTLKTMTTKEFEEILGDYIDHLYKVSLEMDPTMDIDRSLFVINSYLEIEVLPHYDYFVKEIIVYSVEDQIKFKVVYDIEFLEKFNKTNNKQDGCIAILFLCYTYVINIFQEVLEWI